MKGLSSSTNKGKFTFLSAAAYETPTDAESENVSHVPLTATRSSQSAARGITVSAGISGPTFRVFPPNDSGSPIL